MYGKGIKSESFFSFDLISSGERKKKRKKKKRKKKKKEKKRGGFLVMGEGVGNDLVKEAGPRSV